MHLLTCDTLSIECMDYPHRQVYGLPTPLDDVGNPYSGDHKLVQKNSLRRGRTVYGVLPLQYGFLCI